MSIWAQGFELEGDRLDAPDCTAGNKPCGKRCISQDQKCGSGLRKAAAFVGAAGLAVGGIYLGRKALKRLPNSAAADPAAAQKGSQALNDLLNTREAAPYRQGYSGAEYLSRNAELNDQRRAQSGLNWAANDINNSERRSRGLLGLGAGRPTTPGSSRPRRPRPMTRKR